MEWLEFSSNGMYIMGGLAVVAAIGFMFFFSKNLD